MWWPFGKSKKQREAEAADARRAAERVQQVTRRAAASRGTLASVGVNRRPDSDDILSNPMHPASPLNPASPASPLYAGHAYGSRGADCTPSYSGSSHSSSHSDSGSSSSSYDSGSSCSSSSSDGGSSSW